MFIASESLVTVGPPFLLDEGYVEEEFIAEGAASSYAPVGDLSPDGRWTLEPDGQAEYRTRVLVRRPANATDFSGVVLVEWLNVSGGLDADPEFIALREEIVRQGHMWVGVSAQKIGVEGGPVLVEVDLPGMEVAGLGLKGLDPERYGSLTHPGDAYSFDIYTQVAAVIRGGTGPFADLQASSVVAVGESQSAFALVTYANGVQPITGAFDGFFVHSRGAASLPLQPETGMADLAGSIGGAPVAIRDDSRVPVFIVQAESDVTGILASGRSRQPDTSTIRLWEVVGTAHQDRSNMGEMADFIDCGVPINDGPFHLVAKAALRHLVRWVTDGTAPPEASRIEIGDVETLTIARDPDGIALGGLRTPPVDVPAEVLSGTQGPSSEVFCLLLGSTTPLSTERFRELYPTAGSYEDQYSTAVRESIEAGYILEDDRDAIESYARPEHVG